MSTLLRIAATLFLAWSVFFAFQAGGSDGVVGQPTVRALAYGLAIAHLGFAFLFWRASANPAAERGAIYTALIVLGLRAAHGTYEVLYALDGDPALVCLVDMVTSLALFVGVLNTLPATIRATGD